jgi:hypothetical protein
VDQATLLSRQPGGRFQNRIDWPHVGVFGHSYGGAASADECRIDSRVEACADLDGSPDGQTLKLGIPKPFMLVLSDWPVGGNPKRPSQPLPPDWAKRLDDMRALVANAKVAHWISIAGLYHSGFTDFGLLSVHLAKPVRDSMFGPVDPIEAHYAISAYVTAFFDKYLLGRGSLSLVEPSPKYPEVSFPLASSPPK